MLGLLQTNNFISASTITDNGAGTLVLNLTSNHIQTLTGTSAPTIRLPDTTTLSVGHSLTITNLSDVQVVVNHSGGTEVRTLPTSSTGVFTCIDIATNVPASWQCEQNTFSSRGEPTPLPAIRTVGAAMYTMLKTDTSLIFTAACVVTLFSPAALVGKVICIKAIAPVAITSASANVVPADGAAAGTAILSGFDGEHAQLQSDGTNWVVMGQVKPSGSITSSGGPTAIQLADGVGGFANDADLTWDSTTNTLTLGDTGGESEIIFADNRVAIGSTGTTVAGINSISIGKSAMTNANGAVAIGVNANAVSQDCVAFGDNSTATDVGSVAIGSGADAQGGGVAIGVNSSSKDSCLAIGKDTLGNVSGVCIGEGAALDGVNGVCLGNFASVTGGHGIAIGLQASCLGDDTESYNIAIGHNAVAGGPGITDAIAIGEDACALATGSLAVGSGAMATVPFGIAIGYQAVAQAYVFGGNQGPLAIRGASNLITATGPGGAQSGLRVRFGNMGSGSNYRMPAWIESAGTFPP
jgi:hypothetical protein